MENKETFWTRYRTYLDIWKLSKPDPHTLKSPFRGVYGVENNCIKFVVDEIHL